MLFTIPTIRFTKSALVLICILVLLNQPNSEAQNGSDSILRMELLISHTVFGYDTVFRRFSYSTDGFIEASVDSSKSKNHLTYFAEYDSIGRIRHLREYRDTLFCTIEYIWEPGNKINFIKQKNGKEESGVIAYFGALKAVDLPENNPLAPENFLVVRADSTQYLDKSGNIVTTWYWEYDSLGRNIRWKSSTLDKLVPWVEEYSYGYMNGLPARFPALEGDIIAFIFEKRTAIAGNGLRFIHEKVINNNNVESMGRYLFNGRRIDKTNNFGANENKMPHVMAVNSSISVSNRPAHNCRSNKSIVGSILIEK